MLSENLLFTVHRQHLSKTLVINILRCLTNVANKSQQSHKTVSYDDLIGTHKLTEHFPSHCLVRGQDKHIKETAYVSRTWLLLAVLDAWHFAEELSFTQKLVKVLVAISKSASMLQLTTKPVITRCGHSTSTQVWYQQEWLLHVKINIPSTTFYFGPQKTCKNPELKRQGKFFAPGFSWFRYLEWNMHYFLEWYRKWQQKFTVISWSLSFG